ncbi:uncharacterized protein Z518_02776 [Rhinocladiella mackenziei CBS 650.93]|uniref:RRM domain-containing protein n=1 Tax=Rhinocladiella mackenziei CBS 650.93 TaxID=1442369 RepID=A0A0D2JFP9_9EURO|nr:uncharacterized protein Z518_02776 [Rhinocladiella mackenziei CBS 650.93]KIX08120.1 hypothetical protein Z518_02776 [Rhinocladiella mackenziei CBS 650.93]
MGDKRRKESSGAADPPLKKSKKSKHTENNSAAVPPVPSLSSDNVSTITSKRSRKRAADFMNDNEDAPTKPETHAKVTENKTAISVPPDDADEPAPKKSKKNKNKDRKGSHDEVLSADGINGVVEHDGDGNLDTVTTHKPVSTSMQAEAERTVDQELEVGFGGFASDDDYDRAEEVETEDNAAALLAGFDSDSEDKQEDEGGLDLTTTLALPKSKKVRKKLDKVKAKGDDEGPGTVYVGRIPHGFYEKQMNEYFSQFGDITRLRLSRNKRTGQSKHFAFIEFSSKEVAKIVANTMDNYLLFGHILKCKYAEPDSLHPDVWKGANKKFRKIPHEKLERAALAAPKSEEHWQKKVDKEKRKRGKKAEQMKAIGYDMPTSTLANPSEAVKQKPAGKDEARKIESEEAGPAGSMEPTKVPPQGEAAAKESKRSKNKEEKKDKKRIAVAISAVEPPVAEPVNAVEEKAKDDGEKESKSKLTKVERKAQKKTAKKLAKESDAVIAPGTKSDPVQETKTVEAPETDSKRNPENEADFISFGDINFEKESRSSNSPKASRGPPGKKLKKEKKKKERKNLVKARGPKSNLIASKPKSDPNATGKIPGLPLMGKDKYNKAKRQAHKELKNKILARRATGASRGSSAGSRS